MIDLNNNDYNLQKILKTSTLIEKTYSQYTTNNNTNPITNSTALPVLLIHGLMEDAAVWNKWVDLLKKDGIPAYPITFKQSDDEVWVISRTCKRIIKYNWTNQKGNWTK